MVKKRRTRTADKRRKSTTDEALRAWDLRNEGLSLRDIAVRMRLSGPQQASNLVEKGYKAFYSPKVEQRRAESDARLQRLLTAVMPLAMKKSAPLDERLAAMDRAIKLDRELRQLHGADAPETTVNLNGDLPSKDVRQELLDRLSRLTAAASAPEGAEEPK